MKQRILDIDKTFVSREQYNKVVKDLTEVASIELNREMLHTAIQTIYALIEYKARVKIIGERSL